MSKEEQLTYSSDSFNENEISLRDVILKVSNWWKYILSKKQVVLSALLLGCLLGLAYSYLKKTVYIAETIFVLEEDKSGGNMLGQLGGLAGLAGIDVGAGGGLFQGDNIIELYKSRKMIEKTLLSNVIYKGKDHLLMDIYIDINNLREKWADDINLKNINFKKDLIDKELRVRDSVLGRAVQDINTNYLSIQKPDKKLSLIKVEVKSENEFFSKVFNDQIVKNVNDFYIQTRTKKSLENLEILQHQTDSVRDVLNKAINQTAIIVDATPNLNQVKQILRSPAQRSQFNAEANKTILAQLVQNLEIAKLSLRQETPLIQVVDQPIFPLEKKHFGKTKGIVFGGVLFGFLTILFLTIKKIYLEILNGE